MPASPYEDLFGPLPDLNDPQVRAALDSIGNPGNQLGGTGDPWSRSPTVAFLDSQGLLSPGLSGQPSPFPADPSLAGPASHPSSGAPANNSVFAVTPQSLDDYLKWKGSPMVGVGQKFYDGSTSQGWDPRFILALSGAETGFGKNITWGKNNAFNVGTNTRDRANSPQESWAAGAQNTIDNLNKKGTAERPGRYEGKISVDEIYGKYCDFGKYPSQCAQGLNNVKQFMREQGADPKYPRWLKPDAWK